MSVDGKYNVEIDGLGYMLARQPRTGRVVYKRSEAPNFVNKFGSGDPAYRDASFWSHWVQINWQNGARQEQFNDQARFLIDQNVNIHEEGRITLGPKMENAGVVASTATVCAFTIPRWGSGNYDVWSGNGIGEVHSWDETSSWTHKYTVGNPPVNDLIDWDSSVWAGTGLASASTSEARLYRIASAGTLQSSANITGDGINKLYLSDIDGTLKLYVGTSRHAGAGAGVYAFTNVSSNTTIWEAGTASRGAPSKITDITTYLNRMIIAGGYTFDDTSNPYNGLIVTYDGTTTSNFVSLPHTVPTCLEVYDNFLFAGTAHGYLYIYNGASFDLLFKFWGNDIDMEIKKMWVHQDKLHILVSQNGDLKNSDTKYAGIWVFNRRGLNLEYKEATNTSAYTESITFQNQYIFSVGSAGQTYKVNENNYQVSGTLQSSYFDANLPSLDKLFKEVTLVYDYLSASTSATISYKTDETESFTDLGTVKTEGTTSATFQFPASVAEKKISYQVTLSTGNVSATPRVKKILHKYIVAPEFYHKWDLGIDTSEKVQLLDSNFHASSGLELEAALFDSKRSKQLITFKDIDYASTQLDGSIAASATTINGDDFSRFPPKGRLRIASTGEEIFYDSRTSTTLNTVTRAYKNTTAVSAADNATIDNSYSALFLNYDEEQFTLNQLADEYNHISPVSILEA